MNSYSTTLKVILSLIFLFAGLPDLTAQIEVKRLTPFERIDFSVKAKDSQDKASILSNLDLARRIPAYDQWEAAEYNSQVLLVCEEKGELSFDIRNISRKAAKVIVRLTLPDPWEVKIRRQAYLTDFYTHQRRSSLDIDFYGDALPLLPQDKNGDWYIELAPQETGRIFVEFIAKNEHPKSNAEIVLIPHSPGKAGKAITKTFSLEVIDKTLPGVAFPSVIYNNNSYQIASYVNELMKNQFSHLVVKETPTIQFDKKGNITGSGKANSPSSRAFRYVTNMWVKEKMPVMLYLEGSYGKLAPLSGGLGYLPPFSEAWMKAYVAVVNAAFRNIKNRFPCFSEEDMLLYVYDEVSSGQLDASPSNKVKDVGKLLKYIKQHAPQYKTFLTLGIYTYPNDIKEILQYCDIVSPHIIMPSELPRNAPKSYNPAKAFKTDLFDKIEANESLNIIRSNDVANVSSNYQMKREEPEQWSYLVTQGKTANILDFRALPLHGLILGREGMSWWAFSDTKGSSWLPNDLNDIDYSLVYNREPNNPVYNYWNRNDEGIFIPSIRLFAAGAAIEDAKLLKYLLINFSSLSIADQQKLTGPVIEQLAGTIDKDTTQPDRKRYLPLSKYEEIGRILREIYSSL